jgi:hypothetical protein
MFDTTDLIENTQKYYIHPILCPVCTVAMAAEAICKYCGRVFDDISIF